MGCRPQVPSSLLLAAGGVQGVSPKSCLALLSISMSEIFPSWGFSGKWEQWVALTPLWHGASRVPIAALMEEKEKVH